MWNWLADLGTRGHGRSRGHGSWDRSRRVRLELEALDHVPHEEVPPLHVLHPVVVLRVVGHVARGLRVGGEARRAVIQGVSSSASCPTGWKYQARHNQCVFFPSSPDSNPMGVDIEVTSIQTCGVRPPAAPPPPPPSTPPTTGTAKSSDDGGAILYIAIGAGVGVVVVGVIIGAMLYFCKVMTKTPPSGSTVTSTSV